MKQSLVSIRKSIKNLRAIIDDEKTDEATRRMAYYAENTLRWAIEDTVKWERPEVDLRSEVYILKKELGVR